MKRIKPASFFLLHFFNKTITKQKPNFVKSAITKSYNTIVKSIMIKEKRKWQNKMIKKW